MILCLVYVENHIGIVDNDSSLKSYGVKYEQIDLISDDFDYDKIIDRVSKNDIKLIEIQRSRGYALRRSITLDKIEKVIAKKAVFVDNINAAINLIKNDK